MSLLRRITRPLRNKTQFLNLVVLILTAITLTVVILVVLIAESVGRVEASLTNLNRAVDLLERKPSAELTYDDFLRVQSSVGELAGSIGQAQDQLGFFQPLIANNADLSARLTGLDAAYYLSNAAQEMLSGLQPTLFFLSAGRDTGAVTSQISSGQRIVEVLELGRTQFDNADSLLESAKAEITAIDLAGLSSDRLLEVQDLINYHDQLMQINNILKQSPEVLTAVLGLDEERSYLILSQNSDELRPSGGLITTYGWMLVEDARITDYDYGPVTPTSPNPPPSEKDSPTEAGAMQVDFSELSQSAWLGSWYANFPTTAEMGMQFYNGGNNLHAPLDGVIAIDIVGFEYILEALGSVTVEGYDTEVTAETFRDLIYEVRASSEIGEPHKEFLASLYRQIIADWRDAGSDPEVSGLILNGVLRALSEKHIMVYFADDELNDVVNLLGWSGAQSPATGFDYLMVTDANLRNKSNRSITRQITYDVEIQNDGSLLSRATLDYDYPARVAAADPAVDANHHGPLDYTNIVQLFVPANSELTPTEDFVNHAQSIDTESHTLFVTNMVVPYDSSARLQLNYSTPPLISELGSYHQYRLLVQKQPGTLAEDANIQIALPPNARVVRVTPEPVASYYLDEPILEFRLTLETDQWVEIIYDD